MTQINQMRKVCWQFNYDQHHVCDAQTKVEEGLVDKQGEDSVNI